MIIRAEDFMRRITKRLTAREARELLPWYVTGKLSSDENAQVEQWLAEAPHAQAELAEWKYLRDRMTDQKPVRPSPTAFTKIIAAIHSQPNDKQSALAPGLSWTLEAVLTLLVMVILWISVRPGVALEWVVTDNSLANFRVYRSSLGSDNFRLIAQVPAQSNTLEYRFVDAMLIPGRSYVYRVEGMERDTFIAVSQAVTSSPLAALPGQLAILFVSLILGYCGMTLLQYWPTIWPRSSKSPVTR
jgi:hypothetical protein